LENIDYSISYLAILIVFTTLLYDKKSERADSLINSALSIGKKNELENQLSKLRKFLYKEWLIVVTTYITLALIVGRYSIETVINSKFSLFNFQLNRTLFCFISLFLTYYAILAVITLIGLNKKINKCKEYIRECKSPSSNTPFPSLR